MLSLNNNDGTMHDDNSFTAIKIQNTLDPLMNHQHQCSEEYSNQGFIKVQSNDKDEQNLHSSNHHSSPSSSSFLVETTTSHRCFNCKSWSKESWFKLIFSLLLFGLICFVIVNYTFHLNYIGDLLNFVTDEMIRSPILGSLYFIIIYTIFVLLCIPASILTLTGGIVYGSAFGLWIGWVSYFGVVSFAAIISCIFAFLLGRYIFHDFFSIRFIKKLKTLKAIDNVLQKKGFQVVFLLRLSPIVPFSVLNYILALTSVSLRSYAFASIGILPGSLLYSFIGTFTGLAISEGSQSESTEAESKTIQILKYTLLVLGIIAMIISIYIITVNAKKEFKKILAENEGSESQMENEGEIEGEMEIEGSIESRI